MKSLSLTTIYRKTIAAAERHRHLLLCLLLTAFSCPFRFYNNEVPTDLDGSWMRALNMAIASGRTFGRDFIFTYGPLGFLSTRNPEYVSTGWLLVGDLLLFAGIFYIFYRHLCRHTGWWLLLFAATIAMRAAGYAQVMFMLYIVYVAILLLSTDKSRVVSLLAGIYGVLLFFIKVNFGFVSIGILAGLILYLAIRRDRRVLLLAATSAVLFTAICLCVPIDLPGYIRYSIPLISGYDEAMYTILNPQRLPYRSAMAFFIAGGVAVCIYGTIQVRKRTLTLAGTLFLLLLGGAGFLFYRSGFIRYDLPHYSQFFAIAPMFFAAVFYLLGFAHHIAAKIAIADIILLSFINMAPPYSQFKNLTAGTVMYWVIPADYYLQLPVLPDQKHYPESVFQTHRNAAIGKTTIDVFPGEISLIQLNGYNYKPRPVPQSYTVYTGALDSLNARFFASTGRPELVLIKNGGIDERYYAWDESLTKATLHLNYIITDTFCACTIQQKNDSYLFRARKGVSSMPAFDKTAEMLAQLGDTVQVPSEQQGKPLYMSAEPEYTAAGLVSKLFYQPIMCHITLIIEDSPPLIYRLIRPVMRHPVLISRLVYNDADLERFLSGHALQNKRIKAFVINTISPGMKDQYKIRFYSFGNY